MVRGQAAMKHPLRILMVEESPDDASLIVRRLQRDFFATYERVETAEGMQEALERGGWHVIICDLVMSRFSGVAALELLHRSGMDIPFIMVSGQMGEEAAVEAMRAGAHDYLLKGNLSRMVPVIKRELKEAVVRRERRLAEEALSATESRFRSLVEQSLVGIFLLQEDIFSYVNPKFAEIFGYRPEELMERKTLLDLVPADDRERVQEEFLLPLQRGAESVHFFFNGRRSDGDLLELELKGTRTRLNGEPAVIGTLLDITGPKRAEAELSKLWQAVEQSPVSVLITAPDGRIEYVNPKCLEVTGYDAAELIGQTPRLLKSGAMGSEFYRDLWQTVKSGREWHGELRNRKKNGELFWESASISAVKDREGNVTHLIAVKEDITDRKEAIDQLRQVQKMEAVGQLAGGVAHDFNNLLTVINGYSTLLIRSLEKDSTMQREAEQILRAGERAADLTKQLLSFSRRQVLEPKVIDVNRQVRSVQKMLGRLIGENITLQTVLDEKIGLTRIDPGQLEQVVINLVVNARDASQTGDVIVVETANCEIDGSFTQRNPGSLPGSYVRVSVIDQGLGMTDEVKQRLFEPFFTTKELGRGTGLGLATVYGIVKQSGGYIEVISRPGEGARFNVYLPRIFQEVERVSLQEVEDQVQGSQTILVVEDEPGVLNFVVHTLKKRGFQVVETTDPGYGVTLFEEHQEEIDMLLTDVVMPFMSGPALAKLLTQKNPQLKVLFMSGHADNRLGLENVLEEDVRFLSKPFTSDTLIKKVWETLTGTGELQRMGHAGGGCD
jgi:two-component system, cell cycle sensor histidine kinase and response regulator CckA